MFMKTYKRAFDYIVICFNQLKTQLDFRIHLTNKMTAEYITLQPSGDKMPFIGFGCWKVDPKDAPETIYNAIKVGYRLIDSASNYKNEVSIGKGINMAIKEGLVRREDIFVTTKLWSTYHKKEHVRLALDQQLKQLELDYVDMFLVHCK